MIINNLTRGVKMDEYAHKFLRVQQVAQLLDLSVPSVYRLQKTGKIPPSRTVAGSQRWIYSEMVEYLDECVATPN